ncbi:MAG: VTT domain-containing protein [Candidatus Acidiferrum sp.]
MLISNQMINHDIMAALAPAVVRNAKHWIYQLGGLGFIPLGLLDNSLMPIPGSMDVLTIVLSARKEQLWIYYALMATLGSLIGGYVTYRLARKGGKEALRRRFPKRRLETVYKTFDRWGFGAVAIPAVLPPPVPTTAFLFAAGALQFPIRKFLIALALGRIVRYTLLAFLAARYGRQILGFLTRHGHPVQLMIIGSIVTAVLVLSYFVLGKRQALA